ncbi:hypothetical protein Cadr_000016982 [Camelus dromedarius]|uniref:Uncharacterized protein n=1 Tax=Camelus dromedarius TaxID=9838 RepID=A0A5N4DDZ7_CAMDR|nr:hypothetical protein Cadr_000016982 [Camelus dromedarius]
MAGSEGTTGAGGSIFTMTQASEQVRQRNGAHAALSIASSHQPSSAQAQADRHLQRHPGHREERPLKREGKKLECNGAGPGPLKRPSGVQGGREHRLQYQGQRNDSGLRGRRRDHWTSRWRRITGHRTGRGRLVLLPGPGGAGLWDSCQLSQAGGSCPSSGGEQRPPLLQGEEGAEDKWLTVWSGWDHASLCRRVRSNERLGCRFEGHSAGQRECQLEPRGQLSQPAGLSGAPRASALGSGTSGPSPAAASGAPGGTSAEAVGTTGAGGEVTGTAGVPGAGSAATRSVVRVPGRTGASRLVPGATVSSWTASNDSGLRGRRRDHWTSRWRRITGHRTGRGGSSTAGSQVLLPDRGGGPLGQLRQLSQARGQLPHHLEEQRPPLLQGREQADLQVRKERGQVAHRLERLGPRHNERLGCRFEGTQPSSESYQGQRECHVSGGNARDLFRRGADGATSASALAQAQADRRLQRHPGHGRGTSAEAVGTTGAGGEVTGTAGVPGAGSRATEASSGVPGRTGASSAVPGATQRTRSRAGAPGTLDQPLEENHGPQDREERRLVHRGSSAATTRGGCRPVSSAPPLGQLRQVQARGSCPIIWGAATTVAAGSEQADLQVRRSEDKWLTRLSGWDHASICRRVGATSASGVGFEGHSARGDTVSAGGLSGATSASALGSGTSGPSPAAASGAPGGTSAEAVGTTGAGGEVTGTAGVPAQAPGPLKRRPAYREDGASPASTRGNGVISWTASNDSGLRGRRRDHWTSRWRRITGHRTGRGRLVLLPDQGAGGLDSCASCHRLGGSCPIIWRSSDHPDLQVRRSEDKCSTVWSGWDHASLCRRVRSNERLGCRFEGHSAVLWSRIRDSGSASWSRGDNCLSRRAERSDQRLRLRLRHKRTVACSGIRRAREEPGGEVTGTAGVPGAGSRATEASSGVPGRTEHLCSTRGNGVISWTASNDSGLRGRRRDHWTSRWRRITGHRTGRGGRPRWVARCCYRYQGAGPLDSCASCHRLGGSCPIIWRSSDHPDLQVRKERGQVAHRLERLGPRQSLPAWCVGEGHSASSGVVSGTAGVPAGAAGTTVSAGGLSGATSASALGSDKRTVACSGIRGTGGNVPLKRDRNSWSPAAGPGPLKRRPAYQGGREHRLQYQGQRCHQLDCQHDWSPRGRTQGTLTSRWRRITGHRTGRGRLVLLPGPGERGPRDSCASCHRLGGAAPTLESSSDHLAAGVGRSEDKWLTSGAAGTTPVSPASGGVGSRPLSRPLESYQGQRECQLEPRGQLGATSASALGSGTSGPSPAAASGAPGGTDRNRLDPGAGSGPLKRRPAYQGGREHRLQYQGQRCHQLDCQQRLGSPWQAQGPLDQPLEENHGPQDAERRLVHRGRQVLLPDQGSGGSGQLSPAVKARGSCPIIWRSSDHPDLQVRKERGQVAHRLERLGPRQSLPASGVGSRATQPSSGVVSGTAGVPAGAAGTTVSAGGLSGATSASASSGTSGPSPASGIRGTGRTSAEADRKQRSPRRRLPGPEDGSIVCSTRGNGVISWTASNDSGLRGRRRDHWTSRWRRITGHRTGRGRLVLLPDQGAGPLGQLRQLSQARGQLPHHLESSDHRCCRVGNKRTCSGSPSGAAGTTPVSAVGSGATSASGVGSRATSTGARGTTVSAGGLSGATSASALGSGTSGPSPAAASGAPGGTSAEAVGTTGAGGEVTGTAGVPGAGSRATEASSGVPGRTGASSAVPGATVSSAGLPATTRVSVAGAGTTGPAAGGESRATGPGEGGSCCYRDQGSGGLWDSCASCHRLGGSCPIIWRSSDHPDLQVRKERGQVAHRLERLGPRQSLPASGVGSRAHQPSSGVVSGQRDWKDGAGKLSKGGLREETSVRIRAPGGTSAEAVGTTGAGGEVTGTAGVPGAGSRATEASSGVPGRTGASSAVPGATVSSAGLPATTRVSVAGAGTTGPAAGGESRATGPGEGGSARYRDQGSGGLWTAAPAVTGSGQLPHHLEEQRPPLLQEERGQVAHRLERLGPRQSLPASGVGSRATQPSSGVVSGTAGVPAGAAGTTRSDQRLRLRLRHKRTVACSASGAPGGTPLNGRNHRSRSPGAGSRPLKRRPCVPGRTGKIVCSTGQRCHQLDCQQTTRVSWQEPGTTGPAAGGESRATGPGEGGCPPLGPGVLLPDQGSGGSGRCASCHRLGGSCPIIWRSSDHPDLQVRKERDKWLHRLERLDHARLCVGSGATSASAVLWSRIRDSGSASWSRGDNCLSRRLSGRTSASALGSGTSGPSPAAASGAPGGTSAEAVGTTGAGGEVTGTAGVPGAGSRATEASSGVPGRTGASWTASNDSGLRGRRRDHWTSRWRRITATTGREGGSCCYRDQGSGGLWDSCASCHRLGGSCPIIWRSSDHPDLQVRKERGQVAHRLERLGPRQSLPASGVGSRATQPSSGVVSGTAGVPAGAAGTTVSAGGLSGATSASALGSGTSGPSPAAASGAPGGTSAEAVGTTGAGGEVTGTAGVPGAGSRATEASSAYQGGRRIVCSTRATVSSAGLPHDSGLRGRRRATGPAVWRRITGHRTGRGRLVHRWVARCCYRDQGSGGLWDSCASCHRLGAAGPIIWERPPLRQGPGTADLREEGARTSGSPLSGGTTPALRRVRSTSARVSVRGHSAVLWSVQGQRECQLERGDKLSQRAARGATSRLRLGSRHKRTVACSGIRHREGTSAEAVGTTGAGEVKEQEQLESPGEAPGQLKRRRRTRETGHPCSTRGNGVISWTASNDSGLSGRRRDHRTSRGRITGQQSTGERRLVHAGRQGATGPGKRGASGTAAPAVHRLGGSCPSSEEQRPPLLQGREQADLQVRKERRTSGSPSGRWQAPAISAVGQEQRAPRVSVRGPLSRPLESYQGQRECQLEPRDKLDQRLRLGSRHKDRRLHASGPGGTSAKLVGTTEQERGRRSTAEGQRRSAGREQGGKRQG